MPTIRIKRGTQAQLDAAAAASQLADGEPYLITGANRLAVGTGPTGYSAHAKLTELPSLTQINLGGYATVTLTADNWLVSSPYSLNYLTSTAPRTAAGLVLPAMTMPGLVRLVNVGPYPITLLHDAAAVPSTNRFSLPGNAPLVLPSYSGAILEYEYAATRWFVAGHSAPPGTLSYLLVHGNGLRIADGSVTPSGANNTDFGEANVSGATVDKTFDIRNEGATDLVLTGATPVTLTGAHAADYTVVTQPAQTSLAPSEQTPFTVRFNPSEGGYRNAVVHVASNDPASADFDFAVTGNGITQIWCPPGTQGASLGICPAPPAGMSELTGTTDRTSDNWGNYQYSDGSIMCWVPACFMKFGTGSNGLAVNAIDIKPLSAYATVAEANADGYFLDRSFYDGGVEQPGFFYDKYLVSNNGGIASSLPNGIPLATGGSFHPISSLNGSPALNYGGMQAACKTRGANFFSASIFQTKCLSRLALAHAQASTSSTYCAYYDATGVANFPKGANNDALSDVNDASILYLTAGDPSYPAKPKTGSANNLAKTTHNGQACGVADLNGCLWQVAFGLTSNGAGYYALKTSKRMKDLTGGSGAATDLFGAAGIAENYEPLGSTIGAVAGGNTYSAFGSASQVFSAAVTGADWQAAAAGIPLNKGGSNLFGQDGLWDYRPNEMCPVVGAGWSGWSSAGVWALYLDTVRAGAYSYVGGRAALYL